MRSIEFSVRGRPAPKGSSRAMLTKNHKAVLVPSASGANAKALKSWSIEMKDAATNALARLGVNGVMFRDVPVRVTVIWKLSRPAGHYYKTKRRNGQLRDDAPKFHTTKPDSSKLLRASEDDLNGLVFDDDSRIAETMMRKIYVPVAEEGAWFKIEEIEVK